MSVCVYVCVCVRVCVYVCARVCLLVCANSIIKCQGEGLKCIIFPNKLFLIIPATEKQGFPFKLKSYIIFSALNFLLLRDEF